MSVMKINFKLIETCGEDTCCEFEDGHQDTRKPAISRKEIVGDKMQLLKNRTNTQKQWRKRNHRLSKTNTRQSTSFSLGHLNVCITVSCWTSN